MRLTTQGLAGQLLATSRTRRPAGGEAISRPGTTTGNYTYQVAAYNAHGARGWAVSGVVTVNTAYGVMPAPLPSYTVPATNATGSVTLNWTAATPVTQYILQ